VSERSITQCTYWRLAFAAGLKIGLKNLGFSRFLNQKPQKSYFLGF